MRKILFVLLLPLLFACNKDNSSDLLGRWDVDYFMSPNGEVLSGETWECMEQSYIVFNEDGTAEYFQYYQDGTNQPCGFDLSVFGEWYTQSNSSDFTLQLDGEWNLSINGNNLTQESNEGTIFYVRH